MAVELKCENCNDPFEVPPSRADSAKYCSQDCWGADQSRDESRYETKECAQCGDEFEARKDQNRKYCSRECNIESQKSRVEKECPICETEFEVIEAESDRRVCCSVGCMGAWRSEKFNGENHPNYKERVIRECFNCGREVERIPSQAGYERVFCSQECISEGLQGVNIANNPRKRVTLTCDGCGEEFERQEWHANNDQERHFCSRECEASNRPTGEDAHHYKDGYEWHYGPEWEDRVVEARERDGYQCWLCGMPNGAHYVTYGQGVETHHVERYHGGGSNELGNLLCLCKYCHQRIW